MSRSKRKSRQKKREDRHSARRSLRASDIINPIVAKTEGQEDFINSIESNPITICDAPAGSGKAQPLDALVLTDEGYKKMRDIQVGDMVGNHKGEFSKVKAVYPQGKKEVFRVVFQDGTSTECCKEHLWYTYTALDRDAKREGSVKSLEEIMKKIRVPSNNKRNHSIPMTKPVQFFPRLDLLVEPYTLGVILGDGGVTGKNVVITTKDEDIVDFVNSEISSIGNLDCHKISSSKYSYIIADKDGRKGGTVVINDIKKELKQLGIFGKKSHEKFIPKSYKYSSVEQRIKLFQGLMDTDGTVSQRKNSSALSFTSTSKRLAEDMKFMIESFGGKCTIKSRTTSYTHNGEKKQGRKSFRLHFSLPEGIEPFRLKRKVSLYKAHSKYKPTRYIDRVERVGEKECQCISVDNEEGLYLTNNFIVTHNTFISFGKALEYYIEDKNINRIVVARSTMTAGDEPGIGFLPGDMHEKMGPFLAPILKDSARQLVKKLERDYEVQSLLGHRQSSSHDIMQVILASFDIEIVPLQFMRGRTFANSFIILDEAQNCTMADFKMFLTRIGENSKVIIEGDSHQKDRDDGALPELMSRLDPLETVGCIQMDDRDIVRSPLISDILYALDH